MVDFDKLYEKLADKQFQDTDIGHKINNTSRDIIIR